MATQQQAPAASSSPPPKQDARALARQMLLAGKVARPSSAATASATLPPLPTTTTTSTTATLPLADLMVSMGLVESRTWAARQIREHKVLVDGRPVVDAEALVPASTRNVVISAVPVPIPESTASPESATGDAATSTLLRRTSSSMLPTAAAAAAATTTTTTTTTAPPTTTTTQPTAKPQRRSAGMLYSLVTSRLVNAGFDRATKIDGVELVREGHVVVHAQVSRDPYLVLPPTVADNEWDISTIPVVRLVKLVSGQPLSLIHI